jgi:hypothetical protein
VSPGVETCIKGSFPLNSDPLLLTYNRGGVEYIYEPTSLGGFRWICSES